MQIVMTISLRPLTLADGLYVKLASSLLSEGMGVETLHYGICPVPSSLAFDGGLYMPTQKPTCGGNADGAPCYLSYTDDPMSEDLLNTQCFIPINEDRRICYTSADRSRWGYCDCSLDSQWSRPFGKWEVLHNSKFRESDVILLTDDLHAPLDGIACSNGRNDGQEDAGFHCKFRANTTLCLQSEKYGEWHEWYGFDVSKNFYETEKTTGWYAKEVLKEMHPESMIEVVCDIGEVLTGIAVTEKPSHGLVPRCGVPASTWEVDTDCIYDTRDMSSMNNTLNATRCHYSSIKYYRSESDADYTPCPDGEVAIGFFGTLKI